VPFEALRTTLNNKRKNNYTSYVANGEYISSTCKKQKKQSWLMSEQSGPFMQHMPCLQPRDLDDQLSAASTTIQHCSQTKRCLFAFKLCGAAYRRSTAPNLPLSLQTEISVCPFPIPHCTPSNKHHACQKAF